MKAKAEKNKSRGVTFADDPNHQELWTHKDLIKSGKDKGWDYMTKAEKDAHRKDMGYGTSDSFNTPLGGRGGTHNLYSIHNDKTLPKKRGNKI